MERSPVRASVYLEFDWNRYDSTFLDSCASRKLIHVSGAAVVFAVAAGKADNEQYQGWIPNLRIGTSSCSRLAHSRSFAASSKISRVLICLRERVTHSIGITFAFVQLT